MGHFFQPKSSVTFLIFPDIMKTHLFKYPENFITKNWKLSDKNDIFHISAQIIDCLYSLELPCQVVLTSTHNLHFWAEIRKIMYIHVVGLIASALNKCFWWEHSACFLWRNNVIIFLIILFSIFLNRKSMQYCQVLWCSQCYFEMKKKSEQ